MSFELELIETLKAKQLPFITILNKIDLPQTKNKAYYDDISKTTLHEISCLTNQGIEELKQLIIQNIPLDNATPPLTGDLLKPGDICVLVTPIDSSAPKGRLILPQVQIIRDILDNNAIAIVTKETELKAALDALSKTPSLVITDSQAFAQVAAILPPAIPLTSFSILFARNKGDLDTMVKSITALKNLKPQEKVLIAEACTHNKQDEDLGSIKIPHLLKTLTGEVDISWTSGANYPDNLQDYKLIIHCGACMLNRRQMMSRIKQAQNAGVPIINYGIFLAYAAHILPRALQPFNLHV